MVGEFERVVEAHAMHVHAPERAALVLVERDDEHAEVVQALELAVGAHAGHDAQRQSVAIDITFVALRLGALAVGAEPFVAKALRILARETQRAELAAVVRLVPRRKAAGAQLAADEDLVVGDSRVSDPNQLGSSKRVVSKDGTISYLMRQKKEWYEEDQQTKQDRVDELEKSMSGK